MATAQDTREFARRWNEEIWERGNLDAIDDLVAEEFVGHDPSLPEPVRGPEAVRELVESILNAFPDVEVTLEAVVAEADQVAVYNTFTATHEGEYMGVEPTGREVETPVVAVQRIEDGMAVEERQVIDHLDLLAQLGVVDSPMG